MSLCINPQCPDPRNPNNVLFCQACGSEILLQGRYRATYVLGSGGFGKTYEVKEGNASKVLKVLINNSPKAVELFRREGQVLSHLNYPGIPKVESNGYFIFHPQDSQQPVHCLVMEKMDGENLREYIKRRGRPIDGELATRWLTELVLILQQVHNQGILHRDIKPQNIILKPDGRLALIDFGAVREGTETEVATAASSGGGTEVATHAAGGTSISSTGYTPIEQINGQAVPQSDFFALGRTIIFLLTGKEPNDKSMYDAFNDELKWREYTSGVSSQLADLIDQMQARLPRQRPTNAQAILEALQNAPTPSPQPIQGEDIEVDLRITAQEATLGASKEITFSRTIYPGGVTNSGRQETKTVTVNVPPNSPDGTRLRLAAQGNQGLNGSSFGDVHVRLVVGSNSPSPPPVTPGKNKAGVILAGSLGVVILLVGGFVLSILDSPIPDNYCLADARGNIRTEPTSKAGQATVISVDASLLEVTGRKTQGGWIEVKLPDGRLAWTYLEKVANAQEISSCLTEIVNDADFYVSTPSKAVKSSGQQPTNNQQQQQTPPQADKTGNSASSAGIIETQKECEEKVGKDAWHNGQCIYDNIPPEEPTPDLTPNIDIPSEEPTPDLTDG